MSKHDQKIQKIEVRIHWVSWPLILGLGKVEGGVFEVKFSLIYIVSSLPAKDTW